MERLDAFMARANGAYYATRDPYQDFTTSPEITQVFGELLGAWAAVLWEAMGRPDPILLVECGPGRGTLMADALRAICHVPDLPGAARVHLVETSERLRMQQALKVPGAEWHDTIHNLPPGPLVLMANEFLDALPIRQFVRRGTGWVERFVCNGAWLEQPASLGALDVPEGAIVEIGEAARAVVSYLAARIVAQGGAALFVDYGPAQSAPGDSLQALRSGRAADPLANPGSADLTAHVDFEALATVARDAGARVHGPVPQGPFLARLGLFQRTDRLARTQKPLQAASLVQAAQRLAEPDRMGRLFKVLAVCDPKLPTPPGFEA